MLNKPNNITPIRDPSKERDSMINNPVNTDTPAKIDNDSTSFCNRGEILNTISKTDGISTIPNTRNSLPRSKLKRTANEFIRPSQRIE